MHPEALGRCAPVLAILTFVGWLAVGTATLAPVEGVGAAPAAAAAAATPAPAPRPGLARLVAEQRPLAFWPLDDAKPAVAHDATGRHSGTGHGRLHVRQVAQGPSTRSERFDGSTAWISVPAYGLARRVVAATAWFRTPRQPYASFGAVLDTGGLRVTLRGGRVVVATCATARRCTSLRSGPPVTDGAWHQVGVSVAAGAVTSYLDGVAVRSGRAFATSAAAGNHVVAIGRRFRGNLDDVAVYAHALAAGAFAGQFRAGACPQAAGSTAAGTSARRALPALPLRASGRFVVDARGHRVKLAGVNWYGAEALDLVPAGLQCQPVDAIAARIAAAGYNVVRLPWATSTWIGSAPRVAPIAVAANPRLRGRSARAVFDVVVDTLARHGLMVILDNHVTRPDWCCSGEDGNALWWEGYRPGHPPRWARMSAAARLAYFRAGQARWLRAWAAVSGRYAAGGADPQRAVVGADLRNEPREDTTLGLIPAWTTRRVPVWVDWPRSAVLAGNRVLRANPALLVAVEGVNYATDLRGAASRPVRLAAAHHLLYSAHDYAYTQRAATGYRLRADLGAWWGWLLTQGRSWTTPVWVGEFGTWHPGLPWRGAVDQRWWSTFTRYLHDGDIDWTYWSINGTGGRGSADPVTCPLTPRFPGCGEGYGLSDDTWAHDGSPALSSTLHALQTPTQGP